ncbi:MAG: AbgT family transporter [Phycisphaera sp.]|nr:MAG: AbgT family transporter [Phycisphaera sp.]
MTDTDPASVPAKRRGLLDLVEWIGNKLPDPALLFLIGAVIVMIASQVAVSSGWTVQPQQAVQTVNEAGETVIGFEDKGDVLTPQSLLTADGLYWCLQSMVANFMGFAPLGIVLTGMLGIGVAERTGMIGAMLKAFMKIVPNTMLTPTMLFLGIMSSMGLDAGYVVLPPLAAAMYKSVGRSPLAGIAAVFAGVAAGFNANLLITGLDPMLANLSQIGANILDEDYAVAATCNWWFAITSTFVVTGMGWAVTSFFVERRLAGKSPEDGGPSEIDDSELEAQELTEQEKKGLIASVVTMGVLIGIFLFTVLVPGMPLHDDKIPGLIDPLQPDKPPAMYLADAYQGQIDVTEPDPALVVEGKGYYVDAEATIFVTTEGEAFQKRSPQFERWVSVVTPLIFLGFIIPGIVYGIVLKNVTSSKDAAKVMIGAIANMAPIIVLAFFAAQFIEYLKYSNLDKMIAFEGGMMLSQSSLGPSELVIAFILVTMVFNLFIGSMSAKYTMFAPIFVPMLMFAGISPELTQAAYRIGDSTSNIITPLNPYLVIVLVFMQQYAPKSGMGTLVAMMMPYTIVFTIGWAIMLLIWMYFGWDLGLGGPLEYALPTAEAAAAP